MIMRLMDNTYQLTRRSSNQRVGEASSVTTSSLPHSVSSADSMCGKCVTLTLIAVAGGLKGATAAISPKSPREVRASTGVAPRGVR